MRIAIIETGEVPPELQDRHGTYPAMFERLVQRALPDAEIVVRSPLHGDLPDDPREADGWLITGSAYGVYDPVDWFEPFKNFIRRTAEARVPQVGICFGHQIMAEAFGGRVEKSAKGWGCGVHTYEVLQHRPWMTPDLPRLRVPAMHQDQVVAPPERARVLGGSNFSPFGILEYAEGPAFSIQLHPEFERAYAADLVRTRAGTKIPQPVADVALKSIEGHDDRDGVAQWIGAFLQSAHAMT